MPYLKVQTNNELAPGSRAQLLTRLSAAVAEQLGKPERYVMVALEPTTPLLFAGEDGPAAYLELKSIGLPVSETARLSRALCGIMQQALGIPPDRVYIEFADAPRPMWGWNGGTF